MVLSFWKVYNKNVTINGCNNGVNIADKFAAHCKDVFKNSGDDTYTYYVRWSGRTSASFSDGSGVFYLLLYVMCLLICSLLN